MYRLLHVNTETTFVSYAEIFVGRDFQNTILYIGALSIELVSKLESIGLPYKIIENKPENIKQMISMANGFDGVVFNSICETRIQILLKLNPKVKTFLRFFGNELYPFYSEKFHSKATLDSHRINRNKKSFLGNVFYSFKRRVKILLSKEYTVKLDNQKQIYKKLDAILIINNFEYKELCKLFYLPKLIERQFTDENMILEVKNYPNKSNRIIIGNSRSTSNNHLDVIDIINQSNYASDIEFNFFWSYGFEGTYSQKVRSDASIIKNVKFIEKFLSLQEFEMLYETTAALIINSYRQHAVGNIITAMQYGCKVYLNKRSSTYHWLKSKGFLVSEINDDLKRDLDTGNIKLSKEEQEKNIVCFNRVSTEYNINDFSNEIIKILKTQNA